MLNYHYQIIRSRRRKKNCSVIVNQDKEIIVRVPFRWPQVDVEKLLFEHQDWVEKKLAEIDKKPKLVRKKFIPGETFLFFGHAFPLEFKLAKNKVKPSLKFSQGSFSATLPQSLFGLKRKKVLRQLFKDWYFENGLKEIEKRAKEIADNLRVKFNQIKLKEVSSRWGSCSYRKKNLYLNWRLVMAPDSIVNYALLHELCHLAHPHHGARFWRLVARFEPNYKELKKWLRKNHFSLSI